jgi:hypothetical protein
MNAVAVIALVVAGFCFAALVGQAFKNWWPR